MSDDQILDFMAQVGDYVRSTDRQFEQMNRNFEQVITVMHNGFERITGQISNLTDRVGHLTSEVQEIKTEIQEIKSEAVITNPRLHATFGQTSRLTEQTGTTALRVSHIEEAQQPTNAEWHPRLQVLENKLDKAS